MDEIRGTYQDGVIRLESPVSWPDGQPVVISPCERSGPLDESTWPTTPEGQAALARAWDEDFEPLEFTEDELADWESYRQRMKQFNVEAMRKKMGL